MVRDAAVGGFHQAVIAAVELFVDGELAAVERGDDAAVLVDERIRLDLEDRQPVASMMPALSSVVATTGQPEPVRVAAASVIASEFACRIHPMVIVTV